MRIGADTGGTFSDLVDESGTITKVLSTPDAPDRAVAEGIAALAGSGPAASLAHGTTVATNAVLEGKLARVALVTTAGLEDVIEIGRQDRPALYDIAVDRPPALVRSTDRIGVAGRLDPHGDELVPLGDVPDPDPDVAAVAVCLLHADISTRHEAAVVETLRARGWDAVASFEVSPEFREYERTVTTVVNAGLRPLCRDYLRRLDDLADEVWVMTSAGGLLAADVAADQPAALLLSGPAGGASAAAASAVACGYADAVTFDMGGTSTDVCLITDGVPARASLRSVGGYPVRFPSLDIHTIGAGGGSIAAIDPGGALVVGPESAGADPGPACYGRGGSRPTVTDANLATGRIPATGAFGTLRLDLAAAERSLASHGLAPLDVLRVVDANMERAVRTVSVERGVDPAGLALVVFGGAGPLHGCAIADALDMPAVIVPARAGVLSAVGLLASPPAREIVRSWPTPGDHTGLAEALDALADEAARALGGDDVAVETMIDCRYAGQSHELTVDDVVDFPAAHEQRNGYARRDAPIEVIALRARAQRPAALAVSDLPVPTHRRDREPVIGPQVIAEPDCTIWVADGWRAAVHTSGAIIMTRTATR